MDAFPPVDAPPRARQHLEIRAIVTTARAEYRHGDASDETIRSALTRAFGLLATLEQSVLLDGKDTKVLAAIATAREELLPRPREWE